MINLEDFIVKQNVIKSNTFNKINNTKYYRCYCVKCNKDRGYLRKTRYNLKPMCVKCATNKIEHKEILKAKHWSKTGSYKPIKQLSDEEHAQRAHEKKEYMRNYYKKYYQDNKDKIIFKRRQFEKQNVNHRLSKRLRTRLRNALCGKYKSGSAVRDLGCSIEELKIYLESKFQPGMSWDNYGKDGWHIDHIKPLSKFNLSNPEEFKKACHYTNLQPLWWHENILKSNKFIGPFNS
jgi:hypothetical protein